MSVQIPNGGLSRFGKIDWHTPVQKTRTSESFAASFDQIQLSSSCDQHEANVRQLTSQVVQNIRTRPTGQELESLRHQILNGSYTADPARIAARILFWEG